MHVLPRVRELHERFSDVLTVIGVHAGKFTTERRTDRIEEACDRLGVLHHVVNDRQFRIWRDYAVNAWPTVALIDTEGYLALVAAGEFSTEAMADKIQSLVDRARAQGTLAEGLDPHPVTIRRHEGVLRFPTRAILAEDRLWVADTGHGRVLECSFDREAHSATVVRSHDGFSEPRGLAAVDGRVFVADRAAHTVWELAREGRVLAVGTGRIEDRTISPGPATQTSLRSPWGIEAFGRTLTIAMAGSHQVWELDSPSGQLTLRAGTGVEDLADGPPRRAELAQPTGLSRVGNGLACADCESSAVRVIDETSVHTLVGSGLFRFGDRAGTGPDALLQHCEDVAAWNGSLVVADTYNDRLKATDPETRECAPVAGEVGEPGALREPAGISSDGSTLLVCDTGNHRVAVVGTDGSLTDVAFG